MLTNGSPPAFNVSAVIRSDPGASLFLSEDMTFLTSSFIIMSLLLMVLHQVSCWEWILKVQSCRSYNNKYLIALTQITTTEIFAFIAILVFKLLSREVLFINRKDNRNC